MDVFNFHEFFSSQNLLPYNYYFGASACLTGCEPVAINPYNIHFTKAKKHNLCQHLIFVRLYVVERHFKESNTCLRHISHRCREVREYTC